MSRADLIPLSLLRDLADRLPDPIRASSFVDLAVYMSPSFLASADRAPAEQLATAPAPVLSAPDAFAPAQPAPCIDKKGLPWTPEELQQARDLLNAGKGPSEIARILNRPGPATLAAIKRYGVRGTGPITVPGRPKGRFKKAATAESPAPAREPKAAPARKAAAAPVPPLANPIPVGAAPAAQKIAPAAPKPSPAPEPTAKDADPAVTRISATLRAAIAENQPGRQIRVLSNLLTLPRGSFTAADDLFLAEGLATRRALAEIADQLGCEPAAVTARWKAMLFADLTDRHGHILLDGQADLLRALRWLADHEAQTDA